VTAFVIRRLFATVLLLIVISMVTFAIFFLVPRLAGQSIYELAAQYVGRNPTPQSIQATIVKLGLDKPLYVQYWQFAKGIIVGETYHNGPDVNYCPAPCFGYSFRNLEPVWPQMISALPVTLSIAIGGAVLWLVLGIGVGVLSGVRPGSWFDRAGMTGALAGVSLPVFFTGLVLLALFRDSIPIFPLAGQYIPFTQSPLGWAWALVLPWISLAFLYAALYARLTRAGMMETLNQDFIRTARAKGLGEPRVVLKHGLRATLTPIATIFGMDLGQLLGGAVLTEWTFSLPGLGSFAINAIENQDLPEVMGVTLLAGFFIVIANLVVDVLYAVIDPRVRYS
jgi:peptide/nickel transport system permease protein